MAIFYGDEVPYGELARRINRFGHALGKELGVGQEDRVLLVLNDPPSFPVAFFGTRRIGAVPVPVNILLEADDYPFFVEDGRARVGIADQMHYEEVRGALEGASEPVEFVEELPKTAAGKIQRKKLRESGDDTPQQDEELSQTDEPPQQNDELV